MRCAVSSAKINNRPPFSPRTQIDSAPPAQRGSAKEVLMLLSSQRSVGPTSRASDPDVGFSSGGKTMPGIHHVTAIAGDPLKNFDFYTRDLGLRFVKRTVNFDDPS